MIIIRFDGHPKKLNTDRGLRSIIMINSRKANTIMHHIKSWKRAQRNGSRESDTNGGNAKNMKIPLLLSKEKVNIQMPIR